MNKILELKFGSHLYGTDTPKSDLDFKAIYLPSAKEIVLGNYHKTIAKSRPKADCERNNKDDIDMETFSLDRFLELLCDGQTVALDILFGMKMSDMIGYGPVIMNEIFNNKDRLLNKNVNAFVGYARQQAAKYGIKGSRMDTLKRADAMLLDLFKNGLFKDRLLDHSDKIESLVKECAGLVSLEKLPLVEIKLLKGPKGAFDAPHMVINGRSIPFHATVKYASDIVGNMLASYGNRAHKAHLAGGVDWKALSHAVRVNSEALELLETGKITFPRQDKELLLRVKLGELPQEQVFEMIEQGLADLYIAKDKSSLREEADRDWAMDLVADVYTKIVKNS